MADDPRPRALVQVVASSLINVMRSLSSINAVAEPELQGCSAIGGALDVARLGSKSKKRSVKWQKSQKPSFYSMLSSLSSFEYYDKFMTRVELLTIRNILGMVGSTREGEC